MMKIIRNAGGVEGLMVGLDCFSEDVERRLFEHPILFPETIVNWPKERTGRDIFANDPSMPPELFQMHNLVTDSGLMPDIPMPDCVLCLNYKKDAAFQKHFDSRYRWGETVVGVSLGVTAHMHFDSTNTARPVPTRRAGNDQGLQFTVKEYDSGLFSVEIQLPRRSIYVMSGPARTEYKHGIRKQNKTRLSKFPPAPAWNPQSYRRSLTFRASKAYSDVALREMIRAATDPGVKATLQVRCRAQQQYKPQIVHKKLSRAELAEEMERKERVYHQVQRNPHIHKRFNAKELDAAAPLGQGGGYRNTGVTGSAGAQHGLFAPSVYGIPMAMGVPPFLPATGGGGDGSAGGFLMNPPAFSGAGHRLGGSDMTGGVDWGDSTDHLDEDAQIQEAIRLSLTEQTTETPAASKDDNNAQDRVPTSRKESLKSIVLGKPPAAVAASAKAASPSKTKQSVLGTAAMPIFLDSDSEEDQGENPTDKSESTPDMKSESAAGFDRNTLRSEKRKAAATTDQDDDADKKMAALTPMELKRRKLAEAALSRLERGENYSGL